MNSVYIEITNICNLHCSFCPCGTEVSVERSFMAPELFSTCIDEAQKVGISNLFFHVLGEPTLHPEFAHYLEKLEQTPMTLTLTTNGTTIERTGHQILKSKSIRQVNFSTHAYAELPQGQAEKHLQNVLNFCKIALAERPDLYINLRLWNIGANDSASWNNYVLKSISELFGVEISLKHFCSRHKSFNITARLYLHEDTRFEWPKIDENDKLRNTTVESKKTVFYKGTCHALDTHVAILHDGRVVACCLDYSGKITLGRIQEQSLSEILGSPFAKNLHEGFETHELRHPLCQNCAFCKRFK